MDENKEDIEDIGQIDELESESESESESIVKIVKTPKLKQNPTIMYGCIIICIFLFVILPIMTHIVKLKQENNDSLVINDV